MQTKIKNMTFNTSQNTNIHKFLFLLNVATFTFWLVGLNINVYHYAIVGAIFEILWLPMIAALILLPLVSLFFWYKDKCKLNSKFLYLFLFSLPAILLHIFY